MYILNTLRMSCWTHFLYVQRQNQKKKKTKTKKYKYKLSYGQKVFFQDIFSRSGICFSKICHIYFSVGSVSPGGLVTLFYGVWTIFKSYIFTE